jgi:hypothetical protein
MASSSKAVNIGGFFDSQAPPESQEQGGRKRRKKATGEIVHVTLRLTRTQWENAHKLSISEGSSINQLAIDGLNKLLEEKGLPSLDA